jgi:hypothetical protein
VILQNSVDKLTKASYDVENEVPVALSDRDILFAMQTYSTDDSRYHSSKMMTLTQRTEVWSATLSSVIFKKKEDLPRKDF